MADWKIYELSDIGTIKTGKTPPSSNKKAFANFGIPFVTPVDMKGQKWIDNTERFLSPSGFDEVKNYLVSENSIAVSCIGSDMGKAVLLKHNSITNQQINTLTVNKNNNAEYIYYVLSQMQDYLKSIAGGSATPILNKTDFSKIKIKLPDLETQNKVADFLKIFDQQIHLNTQTNQTLEAIAQAIFKSWFVDFDPVRAKAQALSEGKSEHEANLAAMSVICGKDTSELNDTEYKALWQIAEAFPSELVANEEFGEVPKGWEIAPLSTFGEIICGKTPTKSKSEYYGNNIPFIKIPDMHGKVFITQTIDNLSLIGANSQATKYISKGSICVSCIATVGLVSLVSRKSQTNQQINSIVPNNLNFSEYLYLYLSQSEMNKYMKSLASGGSATLNMNTSTFSSIQILKPNNEILDLFHKKSLDIFEKILKNEENNQILAQTRDLLLPKLLSGEMEL
ncbi:Type I restriction-modification system, specificity subunit S [Moraxella catarrhalis]|uniref:restriction endonuclease subunit S n=1 Tax=Moraxella catarrhalis TaxID=480 RepID=UPI0007E379A1|nr:restriction endonuclease subunit S [Moraxella catarrhalis]OAV11604.1 Type I restriction-modification system, specificity subunit S [Moraxella catarrhalis]OAV14290.1 Type I restriction-modification system, specificity subunit S [Moraxella catarrhalis]OAV36073.1 Type I restriction-modification system, specificity subunit S [Moraxella catarrhalis]